MPTNCPSWRPTSRAVEPPIDLTTHQPTNAMASTTPSGQPTGNNQLVSLRRRAPYVAILLRKLHRIQQGVITLQLLQLVVICLLATFLILS